MMKTMTKATAMALAVAAMAAPAAGLAAWKLSHVTDAVDDEKSLRAILHTTSESPNRGQFHFYEDRDFPPQIHATDMDYFCGDSFDNDRLIIEVRYDGDPPDSFAAPTLSARAHKQGRTAFISGLTKFNLDAANELRIRLTDQFCGRQFIYYFDISGIAPEWVE